MNNIVFLNSEEIIRLNAKQIQYYGGIHGLRDRHLLESATHESQVSFSGTYLYKDIFEMAATSAYSLIKNHPFIDGNKRTGMAAAFIFLYSNKYRLPLNQEEWVNLAIDIATSKITLKKVAHILRKKSRAR